MLNTVKNSFNTRTAKTQEKEEEQKSRSYLERAVRILKYSTVSAGTFVGGEVAHSLALRKLPGISYAWACRLTAATPGVNLLPQWITANVMFSQSARAVGPYVLAGATSAGAALGAASTALTLYTVTSTGHVLYKLFGRVFHSTVSNPEEQEEVLERTPEEDLFSIAQNVVGKVLHQERNR